MSFRLKLIGALVLTALLAVGGTYLLTTRGVSARFDAFRAQDRQLAAQEFAAALAQIWELKGNWEDVGPIFRTQAVIVRDRKIIYRRSAFGQFMVVDPQYNVVACAQEELLGQCLVEDTELRSLVDRSGIPIVVAGRTVGTVVPLDLADLTPLEQDFLVSVRRAALVGGAVALAVAAVLGGLLAVQLSAPLRRLIHATERIAQGDLAHRVAARTRDEIGRLAHSLNRMAEALERSEKARRNLLADVAHELRTPLTVIRGNLEAMLDGVFPLSPEGVAPVYEETLHLGELVEDLRTLTLAEAGHLPLARVKADLGELVRAAAEAVRPTAAEEGVTIAVEAEPNLYADVDPRRIRQVLGNLLSNALRYSPAGGTITVTAARRGNEAWVSVRDQGPGIPPEDLPHMFERFFKTDKSRAEGGTGLGLAIARELVQAHGGRIWVESPGGAVFTFALPALDPNPNIS
ncbi:HAMP domain-containing protein [Candidatus Bipolaricaulota bacterium]|nr:HAMP domain-containing protein [Candidatus Bipolaricaulota bacterium]